MNLALSTILATSILLQSISCSVGEPTSPRDSSHTEALSSADEPAIHEDWVRSDLECIRRFRGVAGTKDLDVDALVKAFGPPEARDDRDAGFGVRLVKFHLYGGYATIWIDVMAEQPTKDHGSRVVTMRAEQRGSTSVPPTVLARYGAAWDNDARLIAGTFVFTRRDDERFNALREATARELGGVLTVDVPEDLAPAFDRLTSPFETLPIGRFHGDGGDLPPGRPEIEALVTSSRLDLVRAVLRGMHPEARVYAAWALRKARGPKLEAADAATIEKILALPITVHVTEGCEQEWVTPRAALALLENER